MSDRSEAPRTQLVIGRPVQNARSFGAALRSLTLPARLLTRDFVSGLTQQNETPGERGYSNATPPTFVTLTPGNPRVDFAWTSPGWGDKIKPIPKASFSQPALPGVQSMSETPSGRTLVDRWREGDEDAARQLFDTYVERLVALARRRISQRLVSRLDPEDIVQSVFRTFFGRVRAGQFQLEEKEDICKLLMRITVHKTLRQVAFHKAAKRDPGQETGQSEHSAEMLMELLDREPTPDAEAAFIDQLETFLGTLRPEERTILEMRMQGYSNEEIAKKLDIYDRKIRRVIERIRGQAKEGLMPLDGAPQD